jgi:protein-disulfide isomerase
MAASPPAARVSRFYLVLGALALAGIAALVYQVKKPRAVSIPANVTVLAADTAGFRGYLLGSDSAKVEISEYADYQCPFCGDFATVQFPAIRQQLIDPGLVRWRFRDWPLQQHPHSRVAAHAAACADEQGKFWPMHSKIFEQQGEWSPQRDASGRFRSYAQQVGLDLAKYDECMRSAKYAGRIQASEEEGNRLGVSGTPTFLIGGRLYTGGKASTSDSIRALVLNLLPKAPQ